MPERVYTVELTSNEMSVLKICLFNYYARSGQTKPKLYDRAKELFQKLRQVHLAQ